MLLSFNDICLVPSVVSNIEHRSECSPYLDNGMLPLFTAPMSSVINDKNWELFKNNKINTIIPRSVSIKIRLEFSRYTFVAVSLSEFEEYFVNAPALQSYIQFVCIDIANGHMKKLLDLCKQAKEKYGSSLQIMAGNIANPDTYFEYAKAGIDYIRCSIGSGSACTTSSNVGGIHYPMVSLLQKLVSHRNTVTVSIEYDGKERKNCDGERYIYNSPYKSIPKIVADGGFNNFDQIIKALAIGADYVMLGKIFAMSEEACGEIIDGQRKYYGMSTKKAQAEFGNTTLKTAEGIETLVPIKYTLSGWCDNFTSYLRSAMSYCNSRTLTEFKKNAHVEQISANSFQAYYK